MAPAATARFPGASPWTGGDGAPSKSRARDLQTQLKANLFKGRLETQNKPPRYSPFRGLLIAAIPSALLWWGIISGIIALFHHGH